MYEMALNCDGIEEHETSAFRFEICYYFNAPFDFNFPFRPLMDFIAGCLKQADVTVEISLPHYMEFEDFVTGSLTVDGRQVGIYFEHSLCYVSFASNSPDDLMMLFNASQGKLFQHQGYGLDDAKLS